MPALNDPTAFADPDYRDHFVVTAETPFESIDGFVERLALNQPSWLIRVSTGISGRAKLEAAAASMRNGDSPGIGNWKLVDRTDTSVTFAEDMKIMRYRLTYTLENPHQVSARTEVVQQSRWTGRTYWALITPFHQRFLQLMLRNAAGPNSSTKKLNPRRSLEPVHPTEAWCPCAREIHRQRSKHGRINNHQYC